MIFNGNFMEEWEADEPRESKLVFIGKNLNREELRKAFEACAATPAVQHRSRCCRHASRP